MIGYFQYAYICDQCEEYIVGVYHELHSCKCNKCWIDVGTLNNRVGGDFDFMRKHWKELFIEKDASPEVLREKLLWGTYGVDEYGESLLDKWHDKQPAPVKKYYANPLRSWDSPRLDEVLTKKQYNNYLKWLDDKPQKSHSLMKDMDSNHILNIIESQLQITENIKKAFIIELESRGIELPHI